jgi:4-hydroxybutyrate dehydrogenase/sulfolactaldehyde 3-reductase
MATNNASIKVAFIGLGAMGMPMASNMVRKGFNVAGFDVDASKVARLAAVGAHPAVSIKDAVADADVVVTMLPATQHVENVVLGADGVLAHMSVDAVLMDMSTIDPAGTDKVAAACAARRIAFTDCPVGRLVMHAERGESLFMVGGDDATFARVEPLLNAMGNSIHRCGKVGMGTRMKVINNYMLLVTAQVVAESLVLGSKLGLSVDTIKSVTGATTANNGQLQIAFANKVLKGDIEPGFTIDLCYKDIGLAMAAAAEQRIGLPVGAAAYSVVGAARATAYASKDYSALLNYACELAGIALPEA